MKTKQILMSICTLIVAVLTFVGAVFAVSYWYNIEDSSPSFAVSIGKPIHISIQGERINEGNGVDEIQPGTKIMTKWFVVDIADQDNPDDRYDYETGPNVTNAYRFNVYMEFTNETTASLDYWKLRCQTDFVTQEDVDNANDQDKEFLEQCVRDGQTKPYGESMFTTTSDFPADAETEGKVLLIQGVALGDKFRLFLDFSDEPALDQSSSILAFNLVVEVEQLSLF